MVTCLLVILPIPPPNRPCLNIEMLMRLKISHTVLTTRPKLELMKIPLRKTRLTPTDLQANTPAPDRPDPDMLTNGQPARATTAPYGPYTVEATPTTKHTIISAFTRMVPRPFPSLPTIFS